MSSNAITIAHSPDSDDAFMFYALAEKRIDSGGFEFLHDLDCDPGERENLGYRHPNLIAEFRELAASDW